MMKYCPVCAWEMERRGECEFAQCPMGRYVPDRYVPLDDSPCGYRCPDCEWDVFETPDGNRKWVNVKPCSEHVLIGEAVPLRASAIVKKSIINFLKILFFIVAIGLGIIGLGIAMGGIGIVGLGIVDYLIVP